MVNENLNINNLHDEEGNQPENHRHRSRNYSPPK